MTDQVISDDAALMVWGPRSSLFKRFRSTMDKREVEGVTKYLPIMEPITDIRQALVLLYEHDTRHYIEKDVQLLREDGTLGNEEGPAILIERVGGYGKCEVVGTDIIPIAPELLQELISLRLLSGTPMIGYTDENRLRLNKSGRLRLLEEIGKYEPEKEEVPESVSE